MNQRKRSVISNPPKKVKGSGSNPGGPNQAGKIKNAVAMQPKPAGYSVARNSVTCNKY